MRELKIFLSLSFIVFICGVCGKTLNGDCYEYSLVSGGVFRACLICKLKLNNNVFKNHFNIDNKKNCVLIK